MPIVSVSMSGATTLRGATVAVTSDCPPVVTAADDIAAAGTPKDAVRAASLQAVVFPRGRPRDDARPDVLRRRRAVERYHDFGTELDPRPSAPATRDGRRTGPR